MNTGTTAMATRRYEDIQIECEARRFCDERKITDWETYGSVCAALRYRAYLDSIQPFLAMKSRVFNLRMLDKIIMHKDGAVEHVYKPFSAETEKALAQIEECIRAEAVKWGLTE